MSYHNQIIIILNCAFRDTSKLPEPSPGEITASGFARTLLYGISENFYQSICFEKKFTEFGCRPIRLMIWNCWTGSSLVILIINKDQGSYHLFYGFNQFRKMAQQKLYPFSLRKGYPPNPLISDNEYKWMQSEVKIMYNWFLEMFPRDIKLKRGGPTRIIILNICLALALLDLPPYVILGIINWFPRFVDQRIQHILKIKWIIAAKESIKRCWDARKSTLVVCFGKENLNQSIWNFN